MIISLTYLFVSIPGIIGITLDGNLVFWGSIWPLMTLTLIILLQHKTIRLYSWIYQKSRLTPPNTNIKSDLKIKLAKDQKCTIRTAISSDAQEISELRKSTDEVIKNFTILFPNEYNPDYKNTVLNPKSMQYFKNTTVCDMNSKIIGIVQANDGSILKRSQKESKAFSPKIIQENIPDIFDARIGNFLHISNLCVAKEYRGLGVSKQLLTHAKERALAHGYKGLSLWVYDTNHVAISIYQKLGFRTLRTLKLGDHPKLTPEEKLLMTLKLQ